MNNYRLIKFFCNFKLLFKYFSLNFLIKTVPVIVQPALTNCNNFFITYQMNIIGVSFCIVRMYAKTTKYITVFFTQLHRILPQRWFYTYFNYLCNTFCKCTFNNLSSIVIIGLV